MPAFDPADYPPACQALLTGVQPCELGPGRENAAAQPKLAELDETALLGGREPADREMAQCCLAGLWLLHNFLEQSHAISQSVATSTGSYWHGVMHRREPDYPNAKYWFRRTGHHPVHAPLGEAARAVAQQARAGGAAQTLARADAWDPAGFVDLCQQAERDSGTAALCRQIAHVEWQLLFDFCYRRAAGD